MNKLLVRVVNGEGPYQTALITYTNTTYNWTYSFKDIISTILLDIMMINPAHTVLFVFVWTLFILMDFPQTYWYNIYGIVHFVF